MKPKHYYRKLVPFNFIANWHTTLGNKHGPSNKTTSTLILSHSSLGFRDLEKQSVSLARLFSDNDPKITFQSYIHASKNTKTPIIYAKTVSTQYLKIPKHYLSSTVSTQNYLPFSLKTPGLKSQSLPSSVRFFGRFKSPRSARRCRCATWRPGFCRRRGKGSCRFLFVFFKRKNMEEHP